MTSYVTVTRIEYDPQGDYRTHAVYVRDYTGSERIWLYTGDPDYSMIGRTFQI